jgi:hypothetical protein
MIQPIPEADHICQNLQVQFDRMLCNSLEIYYSFPGFTLLLGSLFQDIGPKGFLAAKPVIVGASYLT